MPVICHVVPIVSRYTPCVLSPAGISTKRIEACGAYEFIAMGRQLDGRCGSNVFRADEPRSEQKEVGQ